MKKHPHIVVTGAAKGIGFGLVTHYAKMAADITAVVRSSHPALEALATTTIKGVDLVNPDDVQLIKERLGDKPVDILLHVAGIMEWEKFDDFDPLTVRRHFEINALAPLAVTAALRSNLQSGSKVVFFSSRLGSIADNTSGKGYGYRMSKTALNMGAKSLAIDLAPSGVHVGILHPGSVKTSLNKLGGEIDIPEAVAGLTKQITALSAEHSGVFKHQNGSTLLW